MTATTPELTRNPVDDSWGYICTEHGLHRYGLGEQHARNVEAKHLREDHADPLAITLNLSAAARVFLQGGHSASWLALTGLTDYAVALELAEELAGAATDVLAAVAPF